MLVRLCEHENVGPETVARRPLSEHPAWSRALGGASLASRLILPVVVSGSVEDRERVEGTGGLERLSLTELVRDARAAASNGFAGLLIFGATDRKDARAFIASERDHIVRVNFRQHDDTGEPEAVPPATGQGGSSHRVVAWPSDGMILLCAWGKALLAVRGDRRRKGEGHRHAGKSAAAITSFQRRGGSSSSSVN